MRSLLFFVFVFPVAMLHGQVPQLINSEGRVTVNGVPFNGTGQFKFALVNGNGTTTYWSNNGSSVAGSQPTAAVSLTVAKGLYSVLLGDATLANMTVIPNSAFNNPDVRLRVWFNDGVEGFQQLTPDQRIAAVGYAMMAANVPDGSISSAKIASGAVGGSQLASGAVTGAKIGSGAVGSTQLAANAVQSGNIAPGAAAANLNAAGQSGVPSSGLVLSATENNANLVNAGYVKIGTIQGGDTWQQRFDRTPSPRYGHSALWTGTEMIVWGGYDGNSFGDGGRYNPAANTWTPVITIGAPAPRAFHAAVWTGSQMLIWGGGNQSLVPFNSGGRYQPATDTWTGISQAGAPVPRWGACAVWTGTEMVIFGGENGQWTELGQVFFRSGGRYNPAADTWTATSLASAPSERTQHTGIWTGTDMIVWGGFGGSPLNDGGRYNPAANTWTAVTATGAPGARAYHTAVWTGSQMIVWGGYNGSTPLNTGGRYNPAGNTWTAVTTTGAPGARAIHTAVWTGSEMIVWGGESFGSNQNDCGRYNPATGGWTYIANSLPGTPAPRRYHRAVWTGSEMIVWGGYGSTYLNDGGRYQPAANTWAAVHTTAPSARGEHTAVWTGSEMIVWGGQGDGGLFSDGGRYNPAANSWMAIPNTLANTPSSRFGHEAVWTGSEMIVWGGQGDGGLFSDGGRYNPAANSWTVFPNTLANTPSSRLYHTAVWTGSEMIVWGGVSGGGELADGGRYNLAANSWTAIPNTLANTPAARQLHTAVWTASEMIVWGGYNGNSFGDGGRYNPADNSWTPIPNTLVNTPAARRGHTAVWAGSEMIVWGGLRVGSFANGGGRYNPAANTWTAVTTTGAPGERVFHTAVWTGSEMIVWGGFNGGYFNDTFSYTPGRVMYLYQRP